ncbi:MAG TPA: hypothetical protein VNS58_19670 [Puia sp.]|nr:hypothetical protein [Puia sp.]
MKLTFFLIAFCLVLLRVYFGSWHAGKDDVTITIGNGDDYEQIKYGGKIVLSDDETDIKSISPGGYIKYRKNSRKMSAESNVKGEITYVLTDNGDKLNGNDKGKAFIREAISEIIAYGFDAKERMERLYKKGGNAALLAEVGQLKSPGVVSLYLNRLFAADSLSENDEYLLIKKAASMGADHDKLAFLQNFKASQLTNPKISQPYFDLVGGLGSDMDKVNIIKQYIRQDTTSPENITSVLDITGRLGSDIDKTNIIRLLVTGKRPVTGIYFDRAMDIIAHTGSDRDKEDFFRDIVSSNDSSEEKWISIIHATEPITQDVTKSNILITIAKKMPLNQHIKAAYLNAAKKINNDADYGRAIKVVE